jgi:Ser/Thr protein kinase RdoA (MazF antagonist)
MEEQLQQVLTDFGFRPGNCTVQAFGSGLIHHTWLLRAGEGEYILQQVNDKVFRQPDDIAHNIRITGNYLAHEHPEAIFPIPMLTLDGKEYSRANGGWFRISPFIKGTHTVDTCTSPEQAFEAARQFGRFTAMLKGLRMDMLRHTIPGFHDLSLRFRQFGEALQQGNPERMEEARDGIQFLTRHRDIADRFDRMRHDPAFVLRVTHHDTKISNVLLDGLEKGVCVIDLDTVMPGYFFSDLGDMMRTYLSPASEEEKDFSLVTVRTDHFEAIMEGYMAPMRELMTAEERANTFYAGEFMIYMQALRFITDHLNDDRYYGAVYPGHNLVRGLNQVTLLDRYIALKPALEKIASRHSG